MIHGEHRTTPEAYIKATALSIASRYLGVHEVDGAGNNPLIVAWLQRVGPWFDRDSIAWCSAFAYHPAFELELERPVAGTCPKTGRPYGPAGARSWLMVGAPINLDQARPGFDIVVFKRGTGPQPGPDVIAAPGHVAYFVDRDGEFVRVLGGNQNDEVSIARYSAASILGIRRLRGVAT